MGVASCRNQVENPPVASRLTEAQSAEGDYISWREHLIDGFDSSGFELSGSDGLTQGDLDQDGWPDFVSVHESDTEYEGVAEGYIRIAFGSEDPNTWTHATLAAGPEAGAAEDVDIADVNGDGWPDIIAACELEHLIYFQNPGRDIRTTPWERIIPDITANRGSFIRVFFADFNNDGKFEVTAPNKGTQLPGLHTDTLNPISWFEIDGDPLSQQSWQEHELTRVDIPENARPVDLDGDGDLDILGGSRGEERAMWFENLDTEPITFIEHPIRILDGEKPYPICAVNVDFFDFNQDDRLDIAVFCSNERQSFGWIEQPAQPEDPWSFHPIGSSFPDHLIGIAVADINSDGHPDIMTGTYSGGSRDEDGADVTVNDRIGRLAWFENPGRVGESWTRHDISRRVRGMFDKFVPIDLDNDGDLDFVSTRGNTAPYDGVFWLEQVRTDHPVKRFTPARENESREMGLPTVLE
ncbi:VCBS repeat-containing protein [Opitutaceae bacterium]|nr:VCBS repeat-containing protein [Opitutaceae bacterium]